ncbi:MAG: shikimate dehydrogenase [Candidatus Hodarchaeota archaeon]
MASDVKISGKTGVLCVIGDPIEHTMSPAMHNAAIKELGLDLVYVAYHITPDMLEKAVNGFRALKIQGINVTIPHKIKIMQYLDEIDEVARGIGAINTIKNVDGRLVARNTDADGALMAIQEAGMDLEGKTAFMLGAGGAARAVGFAIARKIKKLTISTIEPDFHMATTLAGEIRAFSPENDIKDVLLNDEILGASLPESDVVINATPVGMYPKVDASLVQDDWLKEGCCVFDLVYNPLETKLLKQAKAKNCKIVHGLDMLVNQGALAFEWWTGAKPPRDVMKVSAIKSLDIK